MTPPRDDSANLSFRQAVPFILVAVAAFHLAYSFAVCSALIAVYLWCLVQLTRLNSTRKTEYLGLALGMLVCGPQLFFFWKIFGPGAIALWAILGFWMGMFLVLGRLCRVRFGKIPALLLIPFLWTGLEYFRSELYYLRFSWLNAGYVFSNDPFLVGYNYLGMYGIGFVFVAVAAALSLLSLERQFVAGFTLLVALTLADSVQLKDRSITKPNLAGVQLEFPSEEEAVGALNKLIQAYPDIHLLVLSEYTFNGPVPESIKRWCKTYSKHLIVGATDPAPNGNFYDTAFVVGPSGDIIFRQVKAVPIQFMKDGLPATEQKLWESPWGKIGFCVCYDLSYTRVTDPLVRMGAQAIIVPTMDLESWGRHQHELHARVAPVRAAEYGIPIFRLASSGISQAVTGRGEVIADAPMPGQGAMIVAHLNLDNRGSLPFDRILAPLSVCVTGGVIVWLVIINFLRRKTSPQAQVPVIEQGPL